MKTTFATTQPSAAQQPAQKTHAYFKSIPDRKARNGRIEPALFSASRGAGILPVCFPSRTLTFHDGRPIVIQSNDRQNDAEPAFGPAARGLRASRGWRTALRPSAQSGSLPDPELF
ncbi:hypothetical protein [Bradyrhizobium sp. USDA 376]